MDPLPQYPSHAFIPYLSSTASSSRSTASTTSSAPPGALPPISLLNTSTWTYCGPLLSTTLPPSFHSWSASTIAGPLLPRLLPFLAFLRDFLPRAGVYNYWLTIRATKPTPDYDTPRWHTDDNLLDVDVLKDRVGLDQHRRDGSGSGTSNRKAACWKIVTTVLGPHTLFLRDGPRARKVLRRTKRDVCMHRGEHVCTSLRCQGCFDTVEAIRQTLAQQLVSDETESPTFGEAAFFRLGDVEGAVHSEPPCHTDRIFINVVPGSEDELRALMARWGLRFPRAWCFGVPVMFDEEGLRDLSTADASKRKDVPEDTAGETSPSTMTMNLKEEYSEWLRLKGFQFAQIFGQSG
ncbi:hypothetical protein CC78DRAFT_529196 [Lojkania enalia]|uniref:Uncharacterized protein n=1 Tax=Lojkania enalia TaxID=147567 RepID=A0A9P4NA56_9PLEO|nr:hypothetical protein CC78DRAFT_529196 [Didymosphaeria enalia]